MAFPAVEAANAVAHNLARMLVHWRSIPEPDGALLRTISEGAAALAALRDEPTRANYNRAKATAVSNYNPRQEMPAAFAAVRPAAFQRSRLRPVSTATNW